MTRTVPKDAPVNVSPSAEHPDTPPRRRILIVEDNATAAAQLQQLLQSDRRLSVDITRDGRDALKGLLDRNYSIVITDLRMPHLDGMELIKQVQERGLPVTVIVTTGHGSIDE